MLQYLHTIITVHYVGVNKMLGLGGLFKINSNTILQTKLIQIKFIN